MKPEEKLLIESIKGIPKKEFYEKVDWNEFADLCDYHRAACFIRKNLNEKLVPQNALEKIKGMCIRTVSKNMILNKEMLLIFKEMGRKKIDFMAIKAMALNNMLYPKNFLRASADIDFLIREKDFPETKILLERKGYSSDSFGTWTKKLYIQHFPAMIKKINKQKVLVEVHKELFFPANCFSIDLEEIWKDSQKINSVVVPSNEDALIIAVVSSTYQHMFYGALESFIDIKNLILKKIDYKKLKEKTVKYNVIEPMVYFNELFIEMFGKEIKGIKEMEKDCDKQKLAYLRKNSLEKIVNIKIIHNIHKNKIKHRLFWAKGLRQKAKAFFFAAVMPIAWGIKKKIFNKTNKFKLSVFK